MPRPERSRRTAGGPEPPAAAGGGGAPTPLGSIPENDDEVVAASSAAARRQVQRRRTIADHDDDRDGIRGRDGNPAPSPPSAAATVTIPERRGGSDTDSDSERWELTWPIWHMLPRSERKDIASKHGMKSIGEFEEYMSLRMAMASGSGNGRDEYVTLRPEPPEPESTTEPEGKFGGAAAVVAEGETDEEEEEAELCGETARVEPPPDEAEGENASPQLAGEVPNGSADSDSNHHLGGGLIAILPEEVQHHLLSYLPLEHYYSAALVHPSWSAFTRTERAYKILCRRAYLNQSKRKHLNLSRWNGSYRYMLTNRPRVRTHGGLYVLKYARVKKIQRDMWTEIPLGAVLETVYYRYLYFHEGGGGRVTYALTHSAPHEMIPRFHRRRLLEDDDAGGDRRIVEGRYEVRRDEVKVWAEHSWCHVLMQMRILTAGTEGAWGRFTGLSFERHRTSDTGNFEVAEDEYGVLNNRNGVVEYDVPDELFRFVPDNRL